MFLACPASSLTVGVAERPLDCATCLPSADLGGDKETETEHALDQMGNLQACSHPQLSVSVR